MRYQGGKSRIASKIADIISGGGINNDCFVSLFCGSCSVESKVKGFSRKILNDKHKYLIDLLNGVKNGYDLPEKITEEEYKYIREHKDDDPVLTGFVGFGCSFGGKWFGGYARNKTGTNYALQSKKSLMKDMQTLMDADFICNDYRDVDLPDGCVIYADPPYDGTTGYGREKFDSKSFWEYARVVSQSHFMFISEQNAPSDFVAIWEKPFTRTLDVNKSNQFKVTEKLFIHKCNFDSLLGQERSIQK